MFYLLLLTTGVGIIWIGLQIKEEVFRLTAAVIGTVVLVWGFFWTPAPLQLLVEVLLVLSVFSICVRC
ncbi:MAG: hypothetical protein ACFB4I_05485 [Cyanophyceae cyanobacterium]